MVVGQTLKKLSISRALALFWSLATLAGSWALQLILFVITARILGVTNIGVFVSLTAPLSILIELSGLGAGDRLVRKVARNPEDYGAAWAHVLTSVWITFPILASVYTIYCFILEIDVSTWLIVCLAVSELIFSRIAAWAELVAISFRRQSEASLLRLHPSATRLILLGLFLFISQTKSIDFYIMAYAIVSVFVGVISWLFIWIKFGSSKGGVSYEEFFPGTLLALNQTARASQSNLDRIAISLTATTQTLGAYSVAGRALQMGLFPISAVLRLTYANFFKAGENGIANALGYGLKILPVIFSISIFTSLMLFLGADLIVKLVGNEFSETVVFLKYMAWLLIPISASYVGGDIFTGSDRQIIRTTLFLSSLVVQLGCMLFFVPQYGSYGAIAATYTSTICYTIGLWSMLAFLRLREHRLRKTIVAVIPAKE